MTPELRKMAEETFGHTGMVDYWEIGDTMIEAFAHAIANDCAHIFNEADNEAEEWMSPTNVLSVAMRIIKAKYGLAP